MGTYTFEQLIYIKFQGVLGLKKHPPLLYTDFINFSKEYVEMAIHIESPWKMPEEIEIVEGAGEGNVPYPDYFRIDEEDALNCRFTSTDHDNNFLGLESEYISENKFSQDGEIYTIQFTRPELSELTMQFMIVEGMPTVSLFDDNSIVKLNISADMYGKMIEYITDNLGDPAAAPVPMMAPVPAVPQAPVVPAVPAEPAQNPNNYPNEPINLAPPELNEHGMPAPGPNGRKEKKRNGKSKRRGTKKQRKTRRHRKY